MNKKYLESPYFLREVNSVWREALHLAQKEELPANYSWRRESGKLFSFLEKGCVRVENVNIQGQRRFVKYMEDACIIEELSVYQKNSSMFGSFMTLESCIVYHFPANLLKDNNFIREYPELIANLLETIAHKAVSAYDVLSNSNTDNPRHIICAFLDTLAEKYEQNLFAPKLSQSDLAVTLGMHRSTVCKIIKELREEGIIGTFTQNKLEILDREKLKKYAG